MLKDEVMQQQQKAQKIGNQRKSINSYTNKKKNMVETIFKAKSMCSNKKAYTEKNSAQTTQEFNASKE